LSLHGTDNDLITCYWNNNRYCHCRSAYEIAKFLFPIPGRNACFKLQRVTEAGQASAF